MIYDLKALNDRVLETPNSLVSSYVGVDAFGGGKTEYQERRLGGGGVGGTEVCQLGSLIRVTESSVLKTKILGGVATVGDKNFMIPDTDIGILTSDKDLQYYLEIPLEVNRDDANEIFLPGVKTSSGVAATLMKNRNWPANSQYPDNTRPLLTTGIGKIFIPIGRLTIVGATSTATLAPVACGSVSVSHCAGTLSFTRS